MDLLMASMDPFNFLFLHRHDYIFNLIFKDNLMQLYSTKYFLMTAII